MSPFSERALQGIAPCTEADLADLRDFQSRVYGDRASLVPSAFIDWLYRANPQAPDGAIGPRIARRNGGIVGQQGEWPIELRVNGEFVPAAFAIDLMVDERWRLRGVGSALAEAQRQAQRITCGVRMNEHVQEICERSGWIDLGDVDRYVVMVPGAASTQVVGSWREQAVAAGLQVALAPCRALRSVHTRHHRLVPVDAFDERADDVWSRAAPDYRVIARRDTESLRWRFDDSPFAGSYCRFFLLNRGFPTGYVVMRRTVVGGAVTLRIVDYLAPLGELAALFSLCVEEARRDSDVGFVDVLTRNRLAVPSLWTMGFATANRFGSLERFASCVRLMVSLAEGDPLRDTLADPRAWFLTGGDADIDLIELQEEAVGSGA